MTTARNPVLTYFLKDIFDVLPDAEVFMVKLWAEPREVVGADPLWRGSATNVATGEIKYFQTLEELTQFLSTASGGFPVAL